MLLLLASTYYDSVHLASIDAVSYTHLDVYKRQTQDWYWQQRKLRNRTMQFAERGKVIS